ncbi:MAG: sulfur carrier protein ThiS [Gammaproteobacteria bacterium]|nr:sulfur carrier protein ThiS [Gammaproteobacteria bacterium]MBQ0840574.1 sulfur carrier protein ThiS [Gammaproteobacteria bacterium]
MKIHLNGASLDTEHSDLAALVAALGHEADKVATAVNGLFVARPSRAHTPLSEGYAVEVLAPMEGG